MDKIKSEKIYIIGSVASGKTTMAKIISQKLDIKFYELDNVVHMTVGGKDIRRSDEERDIEFNKIIKSKSWIVEGVFRRYFNEGFKEADRIILLDTPKRKRNYRIIKRWFMQKLKLERCNYDPNFKMLCLMYKWSNDFEYKKKEILEILEPYKDKVIVLKDIKECDL